MTNNHFHPDDLQIDPNLDLDPNHLPDRDLVNWEAPLDDAPQWNATPVEDYHHNNQIHYGQESNQYLGNLPDGSIDYSQSNLTPNYDYNSHNDGHNLGSWQDSSIDYNQSNPTPGYDYNSNLDTHNWQQPDRDLRDWHDNSIDPNHWNTTSIETHPEHLHSPTEATPNHQAQHRSGAATTCYWCHGSGIEPASNPSRECSHCGGSGIGAS